MEHWKVLGKRQEKDGDGTRLVVVCERAGKTREAVVSGQTWDHAEIGGSVTLAPIVRGEP